MTELVHVQPREDGRVLGLTIDNPKGNVLTTAVMNELGAALAEHVDDPHLRLVTLRGAGKHFSFGASVEEHQKEQAPEMLARFRRLVVRVASYPVPVAGLIEGRCLGGAFELALCCHFVLATPNATFACPEIKLGVFPPVLAALGPTRLGAARTERLLLTGESMDAETARSTGFVTEIAQPDEDLAELAERFYVNELSALSAFSLRQAVKAARQGAGMPGLLEVAMTAAEEQYVAELLPSHDANEGVEAFLAKRSPVWRDE